LCEPATIGYIFAALSAAQAGLQIQAQNEMAVEQAEAAKEAAVVDYQQLQEQARQVSIQGAGENLERTRQALRERARLRVAMGEAGVEGNSPLREVANAFLQEGYDKGIINTNVKNRLLQNQMQVNAAFATQKSRINQGNASIVNPWQAVLQISEAGMKGYMNGVQMGGIMQGGTMGSFPSSLPPYGTVPRDGGYF
jgi:hypothetical protein